MRISKSSMNLAVIAAALLTTAAVCYQTVARQNAVAEPARVVWIDIERVFEGLNLRAQADRELQSLADTFDQQAAERRSAIDSMNEELEVLAEGSDSYKKAEEELLRLSYEYRAFVELKQRQLERRKAEILGDIYQRIRDDAQAMADQYGYDYVVVNDSIGAVSANTEQEMNRQISARRFLFASSKFDATNDLIAFMNR